MKLILSGVKKWMKIKVILNKVNKLINTIKGMSSEDSNTKTVKNGLQCKNNKNVILIINGLIIAGAEEVINLMKTDNKIENISISNNLITDMDTKNKDNLNEVIWVDLDLKAKTDTIISILIEAHHEARLNKVNFNLIEILIIKIKGRCLLVNITMATLITKNNKGKI
jgi:hypothetical protein